MKTNKKGYTLASVLAGITISIILGTGGVYVGLNQLDSYKKDGDDKRFSIISNAIMTSINRYGDIKLKCASGTGCIVSDGGVYDGCSTSGLDFSGFKSKDNLDMIELSSTGVVEGIKDFSYVICPKLANGFAYSGSFVNPSFILKGWDGEIVAKNNFNP